MAERRPQRSLKLPKKLEGYEIGSTALKNKQYKRSSEDANVDEKQNNSSPIHSQDPKTTTPNSEEPEVDLSDNSHPSTEEQKAHLFNFQNQNSTPSTSAAENQEIELSESVSPSKHQDSCSIKKREISYQELINHILSSSSPFSLTSFSHKEPLLSFACQTLSICQEDLSAATTKIFRQQISKFLSAFRTLYRQKRRRIDLILKDSWSKQTLRLPDQTVTALENNQSEDLFYRDLDFGESSGNDNESDDADYQDSSELNSSSDQNPSSEKDNFDNKEIKIARLELCSQMKNNSCNFADKKNQLPYLRNFILSKLPYSFEDLEDFIPDLDESVRQFLSKVDPLYRKASRTYSNLVSNLEPGHYLSKQFQLPSSIIEYHTTTAYFQEASTIRPGGRKPLTFSEKSKRAQQYASAEVRKSHEPGAIIMAAAQQPTDLGKLVKKTNSVRGVTVKKALEAIKKPVENQLIKKTPSQALAFLLCNNLSKEQYNQMKSACTTSNANIWPNYNKVLQAKKECRPEGINIQLLCAQVSLQNLLDHTAKRILLNDPDIVNKLKDLSTQNNGELNLLLYFKYGLDGCGSFNSFMQKDETGKVPDGTTILASQLVPLQVVSSIQKEIIIFNAKNANSARACRPIRIAFERETKDSIQTESFRLKEEVKKLETLVLVDDPRVTVSYKGLFTMIDGKVLNELTKNPASSSCPLCHQTSRQMSNPEGEFTPKPGTLEYGASILHFGLRSFEAIVKIGYRQDVKKSHERLTEVEKKLISDREKEVKAQFKEKLGLIVDQRRDGGAGNTTTGNVARIALENADVTAEICKVPVQLVKNLRTIWGALASGFALDGQKFAQLCEETEKLYFDKDFGVGWYNIPPTLHKILRHGKEIIENCALPIGLTNEEASEANNKILRHVRLFHARKTSWNDHLSDLYHRAMDVSDPVIVDMSSTMKKKNHEREKKAFSTDVLSLLQSPLLPAGHTDNDSTKDSDEESDKYSDED